MFSKYENDLSVAVKTPSDFKMSLFRYHHLLSKKARNIWPLNTIRQSRVSSLEKATEKLIQIGSQLKIDENEIEKFKTTVEQTKKLIRASSSISPIMKDAIKQAESLAKAFTEYSSMDATEPEEINLLKNDFKDLTTLFLRANNLFTVSLMGHVPEVDRIRKQTDYGPAIEFVVR